MGFPNISQHKPYQLLSCHFYPCNVVAIVKLEIGVIFLIQMGVGVLGNISLLCLYNFTLLTGHNVKPTDMVLHQLVLANSMVLFSRGIPQTVAAFGLNYFLDEAGCKLLFYFHRVARGVSLSTTCFLSGFQAIKLYPNFSKWLELRMKSPRCIAFSCFLFWILQLLINIFVPIKVIGAMNSKNLSVKINHGYCSSLNPDSFKKFLVAFLFFTVDFVCLVLMAWASRFMVLFLHRHRQRVPHIYIHGRTFRHSPEGQATCTILILVSSFCIFYSFSSVLHVWMTLAVIPGQWLVNTSMILSSCFPAFSPLVLIHSDTRFCGFMDC
ncbi:vomeronasal type-1 receptor 1-like [Marmota monax]|uniref:vomeronasal type-1 receptor 1-like n=1 Tax=Marmota monax TaxID=9995 RepID=UPI001EB04425|nr:vomeronasal type-1 receptor 1-like [Marmota monax]